MLTPDNAVQGQCREPVQLQGGKKPEMLTIVQANGMCLQCRPIICSDGTRVYGGFETSKWLEQVQVGYV